MAGEPNVTLLTGVTSDVLQANALFNESLAFLRLASDHLKFIRNFFDPTQEALFRQADQIAVTLDQLRAEAASLAEPVPPATVFALVQRTVPVIRLVVDFKNRVSALIRTCQTQQILPADFIDHLRREADFFLGIVDHVFGRPTPTRALLDLPFAPEARVLTLARSLIDKVPEREASAAGLTWVEFWSKHHAEHADVLTMFLRPQDENLIRQAAQFRERFSAVLQESALVDVTLSVNLLGTVQQDALLLSQDWKRFLEQTLSAQRTCQVQENFPQRLTEHIIIETDFLTEAVLRTQARQAGRVLTAVPVAGAVFDQLTPRERLVS